MSLRRAHWIAGGGLLAFVAWCLHFIWNTSFVLGGKRVFCLFEDSMISLAYARNLAEGHGLNWARFGDPVEGFTNPLWTLTMVLSQIPGIPLTQRPLLIQLLCVAILVANVVLVFRMTRRHLCPRLPSLAWAAAIATACYYPLNHWALVGMETGLQALLLTIAVSLALDVVHSGGQRIVALCTVVTLGALVRIDMLLGGGLIVGYALLFGGLTRPRLGAWLRGGAVFVALLGGYEIFRIAYFGDVLPNTYWLKMTGGDVGMRIERGFLVFLDVIRCMPTVLILGLLGGLLTGLIRRPHLLLGAVVAGYFSYSVYVGGDMYEARMTGNRFVCFAMPLLAALAVGVVDTAAGRMRDFGERGVWGLTAVAALWLFVSLNGLVFGPHTETRRGYITAKLPAGSEVHSRVTADVVRLAKQVPPDAKVAVLWAGIPAYFSDFRMIDLLGYNDREIAKGPWAYHPPRDEPRQLKVGHMKWNLDYSIDTYRPDVVFQAMPEWREGLEAKGYRRYDTGRYLMRAAGEMWVLPPLTLDVSAWDD